MPATKEQFLKACQTEPTTAFELLQSSNDINVNITTSFGVTPLHYAITANHNQLVDKLLAMGANPNAQDDYGITPLHEAVKKNNPLIIYNLLLAGANLALTNWQDKTPVELAISLGNSLLAKIIQNYFKQIYERKKYDFNNNIEQLKQIISKQEKFITEQQELIKKQQYIIQQQHAIILNTTASPGKKSSRLEDKTPSANSLPSVQKQKISAKPAFFSDKATKAPNKITRLITDTTHVNSTKRQKL